MPVSRIGFIISNYYSDHLEGSLLLTLIYYYMMLLKHTYFRHILSWLNL